MPEIVHGNEIKRFILTSLSILLRIDQIEIDVYLGGYKISIMFYFKLP